jgi:hypothetical protein
MRIRSLFWSLVAAVAPVFAAHAGELDGSAASMEAQHEVAVEADYSFLRKPTDVEHLVELGRLVEIEGNAEYSLSNVSFPFARPEVEAFVESVGADYHDEFGFQLVVTSLTRPLSLQPSNAHELSVHPAGMAVDLRVPSTSTRRAWLESRLLALEDAGAIDVTRERHPSHYHVAVFADEYLPIAEREHAARMDRRARVQLERIAAAVEKGSAVQASRGDLSLFAAFACLVTMMAASVYWARASRRRERAA